MADPISEDDILRAIGKLKALGSGFAVERIGKQALVRSVPGELNTDKNRLLEMAQATGWDLQPVHRTTTSDIPE